MENFCLQNVYKREEHRKTLNPYGSQIMSKWIHIRAIRKRTLWCCDVWCVVCVLYGNRCRWTAVCSKLTRLNRLMYYIVSHTLYMYVEDVFYMSLMYSGEYAITLYERGETEKWTQRQSFYFWEKYCKKKSTHTKMKNSKPKTRRWSNK